MKNLLFVVLLLFLSEVMNASTDGKGFKETFIRCSVDQVELGKVESELTKGMRSLIKGLKVSPLRIAIGARVENIGKGEYERQDFISLAGCNFAHLNARMCAKFTSWKVPVSINGKHSFSKLYNSLNIDIVNQKLIIENGLSESFTLNIYCESRLEGLKEGLDKYGTVVEEEGKLNFSYNEKYYYHPTDRSEVERILRTYNTISNQKEKLTRAIITNINKTGGRNERIN